MSRGLFEEIWYMYKPNARSNLIWICIILVHCHVSNQTIKCLSSFFPFLKPTTFQLQTRCYCSFCKGIIELSHSDRLNNGIRCTEGICQWSIGGYYRSTHQTSVHPHISGDTQLTYEPSTCGYWEGARRRVPFQQNNSQQYIYTTDSPLIHHQHLTDMLPTVDPNVTVQVSMEC